MSEVLHRKMQKPQKTVSLVSAYAEAIAQISALAGSVARVRNKSKLERILSTITVISANVHGGATIVGDLVPSSDGTSLRVTTNKDPD